MYPSMSSPNARKRPAPGASPVAPIPIPAMEQPSFPTAQSDQIMRWNGGPAEGNMYAEAAARSVNPYMMSSPAGHFGQGIQAPVSTALTRRGMNRALVPTAPRPTSFDPSPEPWNNFADGTFHHLQQQQQQQQQQQPGQHQHQQQQQASSGITDDNDSIEALEERAQRAKKEAMNKRKQIPPFVQKLSSFLDESKNTDLIRWSDSGDSFIVIDEDEFAKKLIPELFKHNNYASFVRQLNMYGFHKRVGLSDNSMKASERKNKSPSEYYNPYFKRGHPNLLWLINKPKSGSKTNATGSGGVGGGSGGGVGGGSGGGNVKKHPAITKKDDGDADSEEDVVEETFLQPAYSNTNSQVGSRAGGAVELEAMPRKDLVQVKTQLEKLQHQQIAISQLIERLRRDHNTLMQQAVVFQSMHDRHENSINAILNFLANVFRKSLEEQGGVQSVSELLASIIPSGPAQMPQGSVVDLSDYDPMHQQQRAQEAANMNLNMNLNMSPPKRSQRLLPPIPLHGKTPTPSPSPSASRASQPPYQVPQMGSVTELLDASPSEPTTPSYIKNELQAHPHEGMMKIINDTNATNATSRSPGLDLPDMAAKTSATMSHEQRNKMLNVMAGHTTSGVPQAQAPVNPVPPPSSSAQPQPQPQPQPHPQPQPPLSSSSVRVPSNSLSPVLSSLPPPSFYAMQNTQAEIDALQQMQADQAAKIDELSSLLGPLSPLRQVPEPGLEENGHANGYFDNSVDIDQFLDPGAFNDLNPYAHLGGPMTSSTDGNDFDFDIDGGIGGGGGGGVGPFDHDRIFDIGSGNNTPSPADTEEIQRTDMGTPGAKRRRVQ